MAEEVVFEPDLGALVIPGGGPPGKQGVPGPTAFEWWLTLPGNAGKTHEDFMAEIEGDQGIPGPSGYIVWDEDTSSYPDRPIPGQPVTFVGPENPDDFGLMIDRDVWINQTVAETPNYYVPTEYLDEWVRDHIEETVSLTRAAIIALANEQIEEAAALAWKDYKWTVPDTMVSVDEFDGNSLDPVWTFVSHSSYPPAALPTYAVGAGRLSVKYGPVAGAGSAVPDGATTRHTAILRPIGALMSVGDAFVTAFTPHVRGNANYRMTGLVLSTTADAAGSQLYVRWWSNTIGLRSLAGWGGDTSLSAGDYTYPPGLIYERIVRVSGTTWRYDLSPDGVQWIHGNAVGTWSDEPLYVGFADSNWNTNTPSVVSYEFLRRMSGVA